MATQIQIKENSNQNMTFKGIFLFDNIDSMCKHIDRIDFQQTQEILITNVLSKYIKDRIKAYPQIKFLITAESKEHIHSHLIKNIYSQLQLFAPDFTLRKKFFQEFKEKYIPNVINQEQYNQEIDNLSDLTDNFTLDDFFKINDQVQQKYELCQKENLENLNEQKQLEIKNIIQKLQNKSLKSQSKFPKFEHVGGLESAKSIIKETFQLPIKYSFLFNKIDIKLPRGVFLYGPTGCGKTFMAQAISNELGLNYLSVKGPELLNKYIGQSEQSVRDVFEKAQNMKPCIVFFDEFDAVVPRRNSGSTGVTDRVVNQFLCYLDGVASLEGVFILAASSRPELIDPALLRPGRLDKHIFINYPSKQERQQILKIYGNQMQLQDFTLSDIADLTENFTSSDIVALLKETRLKKANILFDQIKGKEDKIDISDMSVNKDFFQEVLHNFRKSVSDKDIIKQTKNYESFAQTPVDVKKQKTTLF